MIGDIIQTELEALIQRQDWAGLREAIVDLDVSDIADLLRDLPPEQEGIIFRMLPREQAADVFTHVPTDHQEELIESLSREQVRSIVNLMSPDDRTRLLDELPAEVTRRLLAALPADQLAEAQKLLGYPPDSAGRYMTPEYVALRPTMTAAEALEHIRKFSKPTETLNVVYLVDEQGKLVDDLRLASLVRAEPTAIISELHDRPLVAVQAHTDREEVVQLFEKYDRIALPVVNAQDQMLGIITVDDVLDVAAEEATEDMQKLGGMEALDAPYTAVGFFTMLKKRGGWLSVLFMGELLTATAMSHFEDEIAKAVVLAMFVPLIISSGGNSGSQAATLIIRALALDEIRLRDWTRVLWRELGSGLALGAWLGAFGLLRVVLWQQLGWFDFGEHYMAIGLTVALSLTGVVAFGTFVGSMLPFILHALRLDPATSSAPFVATLVDVSGLVIYFTVAALLLSGTLL